MDDEKLYELYEQRVTLSKSQGDSVEIARKILETTFKIGSIEDRQMAETLEVIATRPGPDQAAVSMGHRFYADRSEFREFAAVHGPEAAERMMRAVRARDLEDETYARLFPYIIGQKTEDPPKEMFRGPE